MYRLEAERQAVSRPTTGYQWPSDSLPHRAHSNDHPINPNSTRTHDPQPKPSHHRHTHSTANQSEHREQPLYVYRSQSPSSVNHSQSEHREQPSSIYRSLVAADDISAEKVCLQHQCLFTYLFIYSLIC